MTRKNTGGFKFVGTGLVALVALFALGGGIFFVLKNQNQNNPTFNVKGGDGGSGTGGSANNQSILGDNTGKDKNTSGNTATGSSPQNPPSPESGTSLPSSSAVNIDLKTRRNLAFKFPLYRIDKEGNCTKVPALGSADLYQTETGALRYNGTHNFYGYNTSILGTITSSATANLSLTTDGGKFVLGFESKDVKVEGNEIVITGEAVPEEKCPKGTFEIRTQK